MKSCLVIEDDLGFYLEAESLLVELGFTNIKNAKSISETKGYLNNEIFDLIISDIVLEQDEMATDYFSEHPIEIPIIFVTMVKDDIVYEEIQKMDKHIYLVKPINRLSLKSAIEVLSSTNKINVDEKLGQIENGIVSIQGSRKIYHISYSDIYYVQSEGNYIMIFTNTTKYTTREKISDFLDRVEGKTIVRTHRRFLVNLSKIQEVYFAKHSLKVQNIDIPIGRKYNQGFRVAYSRFFSK